MYGSFDAGRGYLGLVLHVVHMDLYFETALVLRVSNAVGYSCLSSTLCPRVKCGRITRLTCTVGHHACALLWRRDVDFDFGLLRAHSSDDHRGSLVFVLVAPNCAQCCTWYEAQLASGLFVWDDGIATVFTVVSDGLSGELLGGIVGVFVTKWTIGTGIDAVVSGGLLFPGGVDGRTSVDVAYADNVWASFLCPEAVFTTTLRLSTTLARLGTCQFGFGRAYSYILGGTGVNSG